MLWLLIALRLGSSPEQIVDDQNHQRYDHQQVNQVACDVQDKTQEPENQEYRNYRAKHADALSAVIDVAISGLENVSREE